MDNNEIMTIDKLLELYLQADAQTQAKAIELLKQNQIDQNKTTGGKQ